MFDSMRHIGAVDTEINTSIPVNQKGARQIQDKVASYLEDELKNKSIIGPFGENPFGESARISPLDTRPKRESDELRIVLNLSYPFQGGSVNHSIDKDFYQGEPTNLTYPLVEKLANIVRMKGRGCKLFKRDLKKAYRQMHVNPGDIHLLGYCSKCFLL